MKKLLIFVLVVVLVLIAVFGYDAVRSTAQETAEMLKTKTEEKIRQTLEPYKVEPVELKTVTGNLNGKSFLTVQFFGAILIKTQQESYAQNCAEALGKVFQEAGYLVQTQPEITHELLKNKQLSYDHTDFSDGTYYTVYVYTTALDLDKE